MKIQIFLIGLFFMICQSCAPKAEKVEYVLSDEQLSNLMLDLQLTEVALGDVNGLRRDSLHDVFWARMEEVYKHPVPALEHEIQKLESDQEKLSLVMNRVQVLLDSIR